jgi:hypothetical protein
MQKRRRLLPGRFPRAHPHNGRQVCSGDSYAIMWLNPRLNKIKALREESTHVWHVPCDA